MAAANAHIAATQSPLLVAAYGALASIHPVVVDCAWVGADLLAGYALARAAVLHARLMHSHDQAAAVKKSLLAHVGFPAAPALAPALVAALYVLHPYTVATCVARSTATFTNLAVLGAFCAALKGNAGLSTLLVAVGTCLALYPALLLVPVVMIHVCGAWQPRALPRLASTLILTLILIMYHQWCVASTAGAHAGPSRGRGRPVHCVGRGPGLPLVPLRAQPPLAARRPRLHVCHATQCNAMQCNVGQSIDPMRTAG
jgi:hypothetical protein